jgi:hypothetical protein
MVGRKNFDEVMILKITVGRKVIDEFMSLINLRQAEIF